MEQIKNNPVTTISGSIDGSTDPVTFTVASAVSFPANGNFRIIIDSEIMKVTSVSGSDFTAARAQEGTSIASHTSGATVRAILTADGLDQTIKDRFSVDAANNYDAANAWAFQANNVPVFALKQTHILHAPVMPIYESNIAGYTWYNQGTSSIANTGPFSNLFTVDSASSNVRGLMTTYTPGQTVDCWITPACYLSVNSATLAIGICLGNATDDKKFAWYLRFRVSGGFPIYDIIREYWSNNTTGAGASTAQFVLPQVPFMLRISDNGSGTATLKYSLDGLNFMTHEAYNYSGNFTSNRAGIICFNNSGSSQPIWLHNFRIY